MGVPRCSKQKRVILTSGTFCAAKYARNKRMIWNHSQAIWGTRGLHRAAPNTTDQPPEQFIFYCIRRDRSAYAKGGWSFSWELQRAWESLWGSMRGLGLQILINAQIPFLWRNWSYTVKCVLNMMQCTICLRIWLIPGSKEQTRRNCMVEDPKQTFYCTSNHVGITQNEHYGGMCRAFSWFDTTPGMAQDLRTSLPYRCHWSPKKSEEKKGRG